MKYTVTVSDDGGSETIEFEAESDDEATQEAEDIAVDWIENGDWGDEGALVDWRASVEDEDDNTVAELSGTVEIEPDHAALMRQAGADPDCEHEWTADEEHEGGCRENPGVWSLGGTTLRFADHCLLCGLQRIRTEYGSQRNPGEADTVEYSMPDEE
jgi:hypothetical protein